MLDTKDFNFFESHNSFDFKGFLFKIIGCWKWFVFSLGITFLFAYNVNIRKESMYGMESLIIVEDQNNPFFTSNTSLVFNWGGTSDKVQTIITSLKSRSHNEIVVDKLQYYIKYLKQDEYFFKDAYGEVPFYVEIDKSKGQLFDKLIKITFLSPSQYKLSIDFGESTSASLIQYSDVTIKPVNVSGGEFNRAFKINESVDLPFLKFKLIIKPEAFEFTNQEYFIRFDDFNNTVANYRAIDVSADAKALSIVRLQLEGSNKYRLVEYLNTTVEELKNIQLASKNQFANNTISFIDSTLIEMEGQIKNAENELKEFRKGKNILELEEEVGGNLLSQKLSGYDVEKDAINRKIAYYNLLKNYLEKTTDYSKLPAPSVAGIDDPNVVSNVSKLIVLSADRANLSYTVKNKKMFSEFDVEMESIKKVLLENIASSKSALSLNLSLINKNITKAEGEASLLPENKQEHIKITRNYNLKDKIYSTFLEKRSEAEIVKAANISDIKFLDPAKDIGGGLRGPKTSINYILAAFLGVLVPLLVIFVMVLIDNNVNTIEDIKKMTKIPVIGIVGNKVSDSNLSVFEMPKSALAESFRSIRSSLQFMYKKQQKVGAKIVMITSSVSGEGKTFCSINLATVFALSDKKTVIVGLDLRKPRIFDDFHIDNVMGVVNYLIGQKTINEVIQSTHIPFLDVISSGPIPPNPSELLMSDAMHEMIQELKAKYDYIVLDTPPVGLVSDALELAQFCDATIYVARQGFTKKGMLNVVNEKHKRGELHNISILFNGFSNNAKNGYAYGYGVYGEGYHNEKVKNKVWKKIINRFKK